MNSSSELPIKPLDASITFLGTASMRPSHTRNVSGNAIRIGREWTIVDCGEGTQHQILRCSSAGCTRISPGNINRIFITHLHGDHCFGLPGLMCLIDNACSALDSNPKKLEGRGIVHIVGPRGLRNMIRVALLSSSTGISFKFRVDELWTARNVQEEENKNNGRSDGHAMSHFSSVFGVSSHPSEIIGQDVRPQFDGSWQVPPHPGGGPVASSWTFHAAPLVHTIDCVGYVFKEAPHRGTLDTTTLKDRLLTDENKTYQQSIGIRNPLQILGMMQKGQRSNIKEGGDIVELNPADFMGPPGPGRKFVVLGDTCDSRQLAGHAANADIMIHEATNAAIEDGETEDAVTKLAISRGHSTPKMAGSFARACGAKQLILTHFSSRYKGDEREESLAVMERIVGQARETFGHGNVIAAKDMMEIKSTVQRGREVIDNKHNFSILSSIQASEAAGAAADWYLQAAGHLF